MNKYGQAARKAVSLLQSGQATAPSDAWKQATSTIFGNGTSSQEKSCPRDAFLGLCEDGLVKGVGPGSYTDSVKNKDYAVTAARFLKANPSLNNLGNLGLWMRVLKHLNKSTTKAHNQQMDVVRTLFSNGLIK